VGEGKRPLWEWDIRERKDEGKGRQWWQGDERRVRKEMRGKLLDEELAKTISTRDTSSDVEGVGGEEEVQKKWCERVIDEMNKKNRKWDNKRKYVRMTG
jgi:hypothetical protein